MAKAPPIPVRVAVDVTVSAGTTHACPPEGSGVMPCCGRTPFEVPRKHRMTLDDRLVTCRPLDGAEDTA